LERECLNRHKIALVVGLRVRGDFSAGAQIWAAVLEQSHYSGFLGFQFNPSLKHQLEVVDEIAEIQPKTFWRRTWKVF
jgi:hypothetical protein